MKSAGHVVLRLRDVGDDPAGGEARTEDELHHIDDALVLPVAGSDIAEHDDPFGCRSIIRTSFFADKRSYTTLTYRSQVDKSTIF